MTLCECRHYEHKIQFSSCNTLLKHFILKNNNTFWHRFLWRTRAFTFLKVFCMSVTLLAKMMVC